MYDHGGMNRFFRLVWSETRQCFIPVPEVSNKRGKRKGGVFASLAAAMALAAAAQAAHADPGGPVAANALPTGGQVVAGQASLSQSGATQTITQTSQNVAIDWQSFNIGADGKVVFVQPGASSIALNRVIGGDASKIYGVLQANGQVFLVNPNGVLFARGAQVSTAGLLASTRDISVADFMDGKYRLSGSGNGKVVNEGAITAGNGGYIVLAGAQVVNDGTLTARGGDIRLAAGNDITIRLDNGGLTDLSIDKGAYEALIANGGVIKADGGRIYLTADALDQLSKASVNTTGVIEALSVNTVNGKVVLSGDAVNVSGRVDVSGAEGAGTVLIGGGWQGRDASVANASTVTVAKDAVIDASAVKGDGGTVVLWSEDRTDFRGAIRATGGEGGTGGKVETSSHNSLNATGSVAAGAGGQWLLDPSNVIIGTSSSGTAYSESFDPAQDSVILASAVADSLNSGMSVTITTGSTGTSAGDITIAAPIEVTGYSTTALTLLAAGDIIVNDSITSSNGRLNIVFSADTDLNNTGNIVFGANGRIATNGGNFYAGNLVNTYDNQRQGQDFTMAAGSQIDVSFGMLEIAVNGNVTLAGNSLVSSGDSTPFYNDGNYAWRGTYMSIWGDRISSSNTDAAIADITTASSSVVRLIGGNIGDASNPLKISGQSGNAYATLDITNTAGDTYVSEIGQQAFANIGISLYSQANSTHDIQIMGDAGGDGTSGNGHILLNTDGAGVLNLAAGDIRTGGDADLGVSETHVSISAVDITFANNSVDTGSANFTASGNSLTSLAAADNVAEIHARRISLAGVDLGTATNPLELSDSTGYGGGSLDVNNSGGSTFLKVVDDGFRYIWMTHATAVGTHSVLFSGGDHIDFVTDGSALLTPTLSGGASDGSTFGATTGIDLTRSYRDLTLQAADGDIVLGDNSIDMDAGSIALRIPYWNSTGVIAAQNSYNALAPIAQITAGDVGLYADNRPTPAASTIGGGGKDIQIAKGTNAGGNRLTISAQSADVSVHELSPDHFRSVDLSLDQANAAQTVAIDLNGTDDINIVDDGSTIILDADKVALSEKNRDFNLYTPYRTVQIDGNSLGTGEYSLTAQQINLNGDLITNGGRIVLNGYSGIDLMRDVLIDSNSDRLDYAASIEIYAGNSISSRPGAFRLTVDSSSTDSIAGYMSVNSRFDSRAGAYLGGLSFNARSVGQGNDSVVYLYGSDILLDGDFAAAGNVYLASYSPQTIRTAASQAGDAGDITFGGDSLSHNSYSSLLIDASTSAANGRGGNVDLFASSYSSPLYATTLVVSAQGGAGGSNGTIALGSVTTSATAGTAQSYTGSVIDLHGNLLSDNSAIHLDGPVVLQASATIRSGINANGAGDIIIAGGVSAADTGLDLSIGSLTDTGGTVSLSADNSGGHYVNALDIHAGSGRTVTLGAVGTEGSQVYTGGDVTIGGALTSNGGDIDLGNADTLAFTGPSISIDTDRISGSNDAGRLVLGNYDLNGPATLTIDTTADGGGLHADLTLNGTGNGSAFTAVDIAAGAVTLNGAVTASGDVTIAAMGATADLTLNDKVETASGTITLAAGHDFINTNGVDTGIVTGTGRYLVYASAPAATTEGMTGYSKHYNQAYVRGATPGYAGSGNWFFYSVAPVITVSAGDTSIVYGAADPTLSLTASSYSGFIDGDDLSDLSGSQTIAIAAPTLSGAGLRSVGTYAYVISGTMTDSLGYQYAVAPGALTVTPQSLAMTGIGAASRAYDGTFSATLTGTAQIVTLSGDVVTVDGSNAIGVFADRNAQTGQAVTVSGFTLTGADAANYTLAQPAGVTADITAKVLSIFGSAVQDKTYDGTTAATVAVGALTGLVAGESLGVTASGAFADKDAGNGKSVGVTYTLSDGTGLAGNYTLAGETLSGDILKKSITIDALGVGKTYDGTTAIGVVLSSTGLVSGDMVSFDGLGQLADKNAGDDKAVTVSNITASGTAAGNYSFASTAGTIADVAKKTITVSASGIDKVYDGSTTASVLLSGTGLVAGDHVSFAGQGAMADKNAGQDKAVAVTGITGSGADADNYAYNATASTTIDVSKKTIAVNAQGVGRVYDGMTAVDVLLSSGGIVAGDDLAFAGHGAMADKNAGNDKAVSVTGITGSGVDLGNYAYNATASTTVDIAKKTISVTAQGIDRVYDGTTAMDVLLSSGDVLAGDSVTFSGTGTASDRNAGEDKSIAVSAISASGADAGNYVFADTAQTVADITRRSLNVTLVGPVVKTGDGTTAATLTGGNYEVGGLVAGDTVSVGQASGQYDDAAAGKDKLVTVSLTGADLVAGSATLLSNYELAPVTLTGAIGEIINPVTEPYKTALGTVPSNPAATGPVAPVFTTSAPPPAISTGDADNTVSTEGGSQAGEGTMPVQSPENLTFRRTFSIADGGMRLPDGVSDSEQ